MYAVRALRLHVGRGDEVRPVSLATDVELDVRVATALGDLPTARPVHARHELADTVYGGLDQFHELLLFVSEGHCRFTGGHQYYSSIFYATCQFDPTENLPAFSNSLRS